MTVRLVRGIEIARIAKTAGFDSLYVDMEHSSFSLETMSQICIAALEVGITPFVRVPGLADVQRIALAIEHAIDAGVERHRQQRRIDGGDTGEGHRSVGRIAHAMNIWPSVSR